MNCHMNIELAKKVAQDSVKEAGKLLDINIQKVESVVFKGRGDIVTEVDLKSEKVILDILRTHFPDHNILSEEAGLVNKNSSEYT